MSASLNRRLSVAPMMDWTYRHCRAFHRALTGRTLLYTEMVTSPAGTTAAALRALDDHGVRSGILAAVEACTLRSEEMSGL